MAEPDPEDALLDTVVEQMLRGESPDIDALLAQHPSVSSTTSEKLRQMAAAFGNRAAEAPRRVGHSLPRERIDHYRLIELLGQGGMGAVYLAEHEFLGRQVALKVIRPELAPSSLAAQRFRREALAIAKLRHANIATVYDAGEDQGVAYIAMELVPGRGLDELLAEAAARHEPLPIQDSLRYARDIARALECAHAAGIVHRDIKPSNVRLTADGKAVLLDFGLALGADFATISRAGQFRGTLHYASPEQVAPAHIAIDARTDLYSLGAMLYECVTGRVPFAGETEQQIFHQILASDPQPPYELNAHVTKEVEAVIATTMHKDRERRYATARALADDLDALCLGSQPARASGDRRARRLRWLVTITVVALCAIGAWIVLQPQHGVQQASRAPALQIHTALFDEASPPLQRLRLWGDTEGLGTIGAYEDGPGVAGNSRTQVSKPCPLPAAEFRVTGRIAPMMTEEANGEEVRTRAAGVVIDVGGKRGFALLISSAPLDYTAQVFDVERDAGLAWQRLAPRSGPVEGTWQPGNAMPFSITATDRTLRFAFGATDVSIDIKPTGADRTVPERLSLLVEHGGALYTDFFLETAGE
ncbi:MAG: serine/threonine-protein kinase [Planctomycetota bacterium]